MANDIRTLKGKLDLAKDVINAVEADLLGPDGNLKAHLVGADYAALVSAAEAAVIAHGIAITGTVQAIIAGVIAALGLIH